MRIHALMTTTIGLMACSGKDDGSGDASVHISCEQMDEAGINSRIDGLTSSDRSVIDLNGHCFENVNNNTLGPRSKMRFIPYVHSEEPDSGSSAPAVEEEDPIMHLSLFWYPPTQTGLYTAWDPAQLDKSDCYDVEEGHFCGHLDDNTNDLASDDDVDLRAKTGGIEITDIKEDAEGNLTYSGTISLVLWNINFSVDPQAYTEPSVHLEGEFHWRPSTNAN